MVRPRRTRTREHALLTDHLVRQSSGQASSPASFPKRRKRCTSRARPPARSSGNSGSSSRSDCRRGRPVWRASLRRSRRAARRVVQTLLQVLLLPTRPRTALLLQLGSRRPRSRRRLLLHKSSGVRRCKMAGIRTATEIRVEMLGSWGYKFKCARLWLTCCTSPQTVWQCSSSAKAVYDA